MDMYSHEVSQARKEQKFPGNFIQDKQKLNKQNVDIFVQSSEECCVP